MNTLTCGCCVYSLRCGCGRWTPPAFRAPFHRVSKAKVAILSTNAKNVLEDYHRVLNLAGYQEVLPKDADTALKVNIS
jgi:hypothetical protein